MSTSVPQVDGARIGPRLKDARLRKRLTLDALATRCGVTKGYLSKLERDRVNPSVAALVRVCAALDVPVGTLFDDAPAGEVVRAGALPAVNFGGVNMQEYLLTPAGERRIQVLLSDIGDGGGSGIEAYSLTADVGFVYVVSGELHVIFEQESVVLGCGDAMTFSPGRRHSFRVEQDTRVLWMLAPGLGEHGRSDEENV